jgi:1-acyl-sn-glycerol-3-phosphate acyltransferase
LSFVGFGVRMSRLGRVIGEILYAGWWWAVIGTGLLLGWLAAMVLPRSAWRWAAVRALARTALAAIGVPLLVVGIERIPRGPAVLVFNHASYVDSLIIAAAVPGEPTYVAKKEFAGQLFAGPLLRRLGALFLDRYELAGSLADLERVTAAAGQGRPLVFFPEGTFTRRPGLSGFYLGAFQVAAQAGLPVVPGVLRGTRSMLRSDQWFPRWTPVSVTIGDALKPSGSDLASVVRLRNAAREVVLAGCGEPDLIELTKPARASDEARKKQ